MSNSHGSTHGDAGLATEERELGQCVNMECT